MEGEVIQLNSRYSDILTELEMISETRGIVTSNSAYTRCTFFPTEDGKQLLERDRIQAIDYEGGPVLAVGSILNHKTIKSIRNVQLIEFEECGT